METVWYGAKLGAGILLGIVGLIAVFFVVGLVPVAIQEEIEARRKRREERKLLVWKSRSWRAGRMMRKSWKSMTWGNKVLLVLCFGGIASVFVYASIERHERSQPVLIRVNDDYAFVCQRYPKVNCVPQEEWKGRKPREVTFEDWLAYLFSP